MLEHESGNFTPTELWVPSADDRRLDEAIERARHEMNQKNPAQIVEGLKQNVEYSETGIAFAILKGENPEEYSSTEALVMFNPFGNAATPNMLVRAEFIREVAKQAGVCDSEGKLKPVIMLANPGIRGSILHLNWEERQEIRSGELGPAARELLRAVSQKEIGQVALLGFSLGADLALAGARQVYRANLDTSAVAVGDPAGTEARSMPHLMGDFFKAGAKDLKQAVEATGLDAQKKALGSGTVDFMRFGVSALNPQNLNMYKGLGRDVFEARVQQILDQGDIDTLIIGYGSDSAIAKPEKIEPAMQRLYEKNGPDSFVSIKVEGGNHTWGDQLTLLAKLYMRAVC